MRWPWQRRRARVTGDGPSDGPTAPAQAEPPRGGAVPEMTVVYLHVPKCGGTSLHEWMIDVLAPGVMSPERLRLPAEPPAERLAALQHHRVFSGHFDVVDLDHFPTPQRRFTVFRDPVDRIVSLYDYWRAYDPEFVEEHDLQGPRVALEQTFEEFVGDPHPSVVHDLDNTIVRTFAGRIRDDLPLDDPEATLAAAVGFVRSLDHVGHVGRLGDTVTWLCTQFGLPRDAGATLGRSNVRGQWSEEHLRHVEQTAVSRAAAAALEPLVSLDRRLIELAAQP